MLFKRREGRCAKCVLCACLCGSATITVYVCGRWRPMSWYRSGNRTGPILRTWGTWVDVRGLTESKGLRPGPTQTLTYCVCCLRHCVLENKSFGGDTGSKGYPWAATHPEPFVTYLMFVFSLAHVETTLHHWQYSSCTTFFLLLLFFLTPMSPVSGNIRGGRYCEVKVRKALGGGNGLIASLSSLRQKKGASW